MLAVVEQLARLLVLAAVAASAVIALTHHAVRRQWLQPFGAWPRLVRRVGDPVLVPLERRILRAGGNPQDAGLWLVGLAVVGGLVLLTLVGWVADVLYSLGAMARLGPSAWLRQGVHLLFNVLTFALLVRVIASWFGGSPYAKWLRPAYVLTDWLLDPLRRILPPFGPLDLSPIVAYFMLVLARSALLSLL